MFYKYFNKNSANNTKKLEKDLWKFYKLSNNIHKRIKSGCFNKDFFRKTLLLEDLGYKIKSKLQSNHTTLPSKEKEIKFYKKIHEFAFYVSKPLFFLSVFSMLVYKEFLLNLVPLTASILSLTVSIFSYLKLKNLEKKQEVLNSLPKKIMDYY